MKKGKIIVSALALFVAIGAAFAFKVNNTLPGNLMYINAEGSCVYAPCATVDQTGNPCMNYPLYTPSDYMPCTERWLYDGPAWVTDGGN